MPLLLLLLAVVADAAAAVPVRLPPQEQAAEWQEALSLAGLGVGAVGDGPWVDVMAGGASWTVRVRDVRGVVHEAPVAPPKTEQDREDIAWLAASLLQPVDGVPAGPTPTPRPVTRPVVRPVVATPEPAVIPAPVAVVPPAEAPAAPLAPPPPAAPRPAHHTLVEERAGVGIDVRPGSRAAGVGWAEVRFGGKSPLRTGIGVGGAAPAALTRGESAVDHWSAELWGGAWYAVAGPVGLDFGVTAGVAFRSFAEHSVVVLAGFPIPVVATQLGLAVPVASWMSVEPTVRLAVDTRPVYILSEGDDPLLFGDWSVRGGIAVRFGKTRADE